MKEIRWGIIGCGDVTEVKSGPALQKAENSRLMAVMRRDAAKAADYARRHQVPRWYSDAASLISDPEVDAVYVATPPSEHKNYTLLAARAGKPVYVEKPMARSYPECVEMIRTCREQNVPLFVAYYRRRLPRFLKVRDLVESGAIGDVRFVTVRQYMPPLPGDLNSAELPWHVIPEIAGGGRFLDLASHTLDILDYILGPVKTVSGEAENQAGWYPAEDVVCGSFRFETGVLGTGLWNFSSYAGFDENEIVGSRGRIQFSTFGDNPVVLFTSEGAQEFNFQNPRHIQQPLIQTVVDNLLGGDVCPSTGESGARTNWVMDQILESWRFKNNIRF